MAREPILEGTRLQDINLDIENAWSTNQRQIDQWAKTTDTLDVLLAKQKSVGSRVTEILENPNKDETHKIWWNDFCGEEAEACGVDNGCGDLTADESELDSQEYAVTQCLQKRFAVSETTFAGSFRDLEQYVTDNLNQVVLQLVNGLNKSAIQFLQANAGVSRGNKFGGINGANQYIIPSEWIENENTKLYTKMLFEAQRSRILNPFIIDMGNLWEMNTNAAFDGANGEGKGNAARARAFNINYDIFGGGQVPEAAGSTFIVAPYAYAFINKSWYRKRETPTQGHVSFTGKTPVYDPTLEKWKYYIEIPAYGIYLDVLKQRVCENGKKDRYKHIWQFTLNYDWLLNPTGCPDDNGDAVTGIVEFANEATASS
ncbi:MAG: hypothetical protein ACTHLE_04110 [Agriterribacter sp.]